MSSTIPESRCTNIVNGEHHRKLAGLKRHGQPQKPDQAQSSFDASQVAVASKPRTSSEETLVHQEPVLVTPAGFRFTTFQWRALILAGGLYITTGIILQMPVLTGPKLVADIGLSGMTEHIVERGQAMTFVGWAVSAPATAAMDRFGRKKPTLLMAAVVVLCTAGSVVAAQFSWTNTYIMSLFLVGFGFGYGSGACLLLQEAFSPRQQAGLMSGIHVVYGIVQIGFIALCALFTRAWSWTAETIFYIVCPMILLVLLSCTLLSELPIDKSPLHTNGNGEEKVSKMKFGTFLFFSGVLAIGNVASCVSYYGLSYAAGQLSDDLYFNSALMILVDIVGASLAAPLIAKFGSSMAHSGLFFGSGLCLCACVNLPRGSSSVVGCALIGRLFLATTFTSNSVLMVEMFDPAWRGSAIGVVGFLGRFSTLLAPVAAKWPISKSCYAFSVVCLLAAVCTLVLLPSTQIGVGQYK